MKPNLITYILLIFTIFGGLINILLFQNILLNFVFFINSYYSFKGSIKLL